MTRKRKGKDSLDMGATAESTIFTPEESIVAVAEAFGIPLEEAKAAARGE